MVNNNEWDINTGFKYYESADPNFPPYRFDQNLTYLTGLLIKTVNIRVTVTTIRLKMKGCSEKNS